MLSIILILLFMLSVLSVPVCQGVISGLYLFGLKVFPGLFISFIITNILVRLIEYKKINNPLILVAAGLMTGFPNGAYICAWYHKNNPESRLADMLAGIINIPSPAFLISYVYINILEKCIDIYTFLIITYLPVIICSFVVIALIPALLFGMYIVGYQHFKLNGILEEANFAELFGYGFLAVLPKIIVW